VILDFDDLKAILNLAESSESEYPALEYLMDATESAVKIYCSCEFEYQATYSETIQVTGSRRIIDLTLLPISSVSSVTVDGEAISSSDYRINSSWGIKLSSQVTDADVVVTYSGGHQRQSIPKALRKALNMQVAYEFQSIDQIGATSVRTEGGTVERPALQLLPEVRRLLQPFRHPMRSRW